MVGISSNADVELNEFGWRVVLGQPARFTSVAQHLRWIDQVLGAEFCVLQRVGGAFHQRM